MVNWFNYFVTNKNSRLTKGHLPSKDLYNTILNHDGGEAYCCYFDLDYSLLKNEFFTGEYEPDGKKIYDYLPQGQEPQADFYKPEITFTQYEGICKPALNMVSFDFDSEDVEDSLEDVKRFVNWIGVDDIAVFFSGSKGFHVMIPWGYFPLESSPHLPNQLKDAAKILKETYPTLDTSIYNYNRKFRVPFTKHDKSGKYKIPFPIEDLDKSIKYFLDMSENQFKIDFLEEIKPDLPREPLAHLVELFSKAARKSYEIEKEKAGTKHKPSSFEIFDDKLCIKKMLDNRCDSVGRNNACLRIVNDYFRTGKLKETCEKDLYAWGARVGLPATEITSIITNVYDRNANYNFGCQDECKSTFCTAKCELWRKLDSDKRPIVADAPASEAIKLKSDFQGVKFLMEKLFGSIFDDVSKKFSLGTVVKQGRNDLFYYKDNHWQYLEGHKIDIIKVRLNAEFNHKLSMNRLNGIFDLLTTYIPHVPDGVDLFSPKKEMANFIDGTLHLTHKNGHYGLEFKDHDKENFCTSMIEVSYQSFLDNPEHNNDEFEKWLMEYVENDLDRYLLVQEMFAASIMPAFPQFFVLLGESGTGKSTIIKILKNLHIKANYICGVSPDKFHGFHMQSMIGKLINIVMDIKTSTRIDDDVVKQVDDGEPIRIERKRLDDIYASIPPLHILGANKMPSTMEGYSGAMNRRFSIINFDKVFSGKKNRHISDDLFNASPQGVLNFALKGLNRLVLENNGNYTKTKRSQDNIDKWVRKSDIISQFLKDISEEGLRRNGEHIVIVQDESLSIKKLELWNVFKNWQLDALEKNNHFGKIKFYSKLGEHGFKSKHREEGNFYEGLGMESDLKGDASV